MASPAHYFNHFQMHIPTSHSFTGFSKNGFYMRKIPQLPDGWTTELPFSLHVATEAFLVLTFPLQCWGSAARGSEPSWAARGAEPREVREGETCPGAKCTSVLRAVAKPHVRPGWTRVLRAVALSLQTTTGLPNEKLHSMSN